MTVRVALALGSGGARGYAHIGVIEELERRGFQIVRVAGSSMGALVAGAYAAGELPAYTDWVRGLSGRDVWREMDPSFRPTGVIRAERVLTHVTDLIGNRLIEELPIPFTAVAVDLVAAQEVWIDRGPLADAIRASIAIPGFITPAEHDGRVLVDGGVMCPVPVSAMTTADADVVVAVSLQGRRHQQLGGELGADDVGVTTEVTEVAEPPRVRMLQTMAMSLEAAQIALAAYALSAHPPAVLIEVPRDACRTMDFHRAADVIELGRQLADAALDRTVGATA